MLAQTHRDLELVVYDDAGDLEDAVRSFAAADPRVRYVRAEQTLGPSGRFRAAVAFCRGEYVGVLDDDDRYAPEFVARLAAALDAEPAAGVAFCRAAWDIDGRLVVPDEPLVPGVQPDAARALLTFRWGTSPSRMLIRRGALEAMADMPDGVAPDLYLNVRAADEGWAHVLVDAQLAVLRWHPEQLSRLDEGNLQVATFSALALDDPGLEPARRAALARMLVRRALFRLRAGGRRAARADLREARSADTREAAAARRAIALAALLPLAGPAAARAAFALPALQRRRALPPGVPGRGAAFGRVSGGA